MTVPSRQPQSHLMLHRHALESIFGLLSFDELRVALLVSRRWFDAVCSMRGLNAGQRLFVHSAERLTAVLRSPLARHVSVMSCSSLPPPLLLSRAQVQRIASRMRFLRDLRFLPAEDDWSQPLPFPATLRTVSLFDGWRMDDSPQRVIDDAVAAARFNALIVIFARQEQLEELSLEVHHRVLPALSFAPLQSLPALRSLGLSSSRTPLTLTAVQAEELRALTQLDFLDCAIDVASLLQLLQPPANSRLQWTRLPRGSPITDAVVALLPSLLRLRTLSLSSFPPSLSSLDFLAQLPSVTRLALSPRFKHSGGYSTTDRERMDERLLALSITLPQVTNLTLSATMLTTQQLKALLAHIPQLRKLVLAHVHTIDALTFLEPVRHSLRSLLLLNYNRIGDASLTAESLSYLHQLPHLTRLELT